MAGRERYRIGERRHADGQCPHTAFDAETQEYHPCTKRGRHTTHVAEDGREWT